MDDNALGQLDVDATTVKRAQWEAFEFSVSAGSVEVRNDSYPDDEVADHTYSVEIEDGVPARCDCPADEYHDGACKHRVSVAIREPLLEAASVAETPASVGEDTTPAVATDGGVATISYTEHIEAPEQGGKKYVRCEGCGRELLEELGGRDRLSHADSCPASEVSH